MLKELASSWKRDVAVVIIIVVIIFSIIMYNNPPNLNVTKPTDWQHFPGATITNEGVYFKPLGQVIIHQDGSQSQPNPPLNIRGPHLEVKGDFKVTVTVKINDGGSFRLYSSPPIIYDQWRLESPSIDIGFATSSITMRIWDGTASTPMDIRTFKKNLKETSVISLERSKDQFILSEHGQVMGSMPDHNIFAKGEVWFGVDSATTSPGWTLKSFKAEAINEGNVKIILASPLLVGVVNNSGLRDSFATTSRKIKIGAAVSINPLLIDKDYRQLVSQEFSIITPENSMKPQFIHPQPEIYTFEESDQLVEAALKNNIEIHGHALVYHKSMPEWMVNIPRELRAGVLEDHIKQVVGHFKGRVAEWDVVNEPLSTKWALFKNGNDGLEQTIWYEAMGEQYIDLAFIAAKEADPEAKLYLNEYGIERNGERWDALLNLVKRLKQRGVPIDGVGFEAHVYNDGDYLKKDELRDHMKELNDLGLLTRISEIDVTGDDPLEQIHQYLLALDVCLKAPNCTAYSTWGVSDRYGSTTRSDRYPLVYGTSLIWDTDMKAKPVYEALKARLAQ